MEKSVEIIPALMPRTFDELFLLEPLVGACDLVQIDIMDGVFTTGRTWPYVRGHVDEHFVAMATQEEGMPYWSDLDFEADLMISSPENSWRDWIALGAKRIIVHIEALQNPAKFIEQFFEGSVSKDSALYTELGFAINLDTPLEMLFPHIERLDFVQCMGISRIGQQGAPFDERVLVRVGELRKRYPNLIIGVDGGVNFSTAPLLVEAGANRLAVGSAIMHEESPARALEEFKQLF